MNRCFHAFFDKASFTLMTALGLIATVLYTSSGNPLPTSAIVICVIIGIIGIITAAVQFHRSWIGLKDEFDSLQTFREAFDKFPDNWKMAFAEMVNKGSVMQSVIPEFYAFRDSGFVYLDTASGRFYLHPHFNNRQVRKLIKSHVSATQP